MPNPTRIVMARHPSRIPKPPARVPVERVARVVPAQGMPVIVISSAAPAPEAARGRKPRLEQHDPAALAAAAERVWRVVSGQEKG